MLQKMLQKRFLCAILVFAVTFAVVPLTSSSKEHNSVTAAVGLYVAGARFYRGLADLEKLDDSNMWECAKSDDLHTFTVRLFKTADGIINVLTFIESEKRKFENVFENLLQTALAMPTPQGVGSLHYNLGHRPFLTLMIWTYPTHMQLATKILGRTQETLPCVLKEKDKYTAGRSVTLGYSFYRYR